MGLNSDRAAIKTLSQDGEPCQNEQRPQNSAVGMSKKTAWLLLAVIRIQVGQLGSSVSDQADPGNSCFPHVFSIEEAFRRKLYRENTARDNSI